MNYKFIVLIVAAFIVFQDVSKFDYHHHHCGCDACGNLFHGVEFHLRNPHGIRVGYVFEKSSY